MWIIGIDSEMEVIVAALLVTPHWTKSRNQFLFDESTLARAMTWFEIGTGQNDEANLVTNMQMLSR